MSNVASARGSLEEWNRLELATRRLMDEFAASRRRAEAAEQRAAELERTLRDVSQGAIDPVSLGDRPDAAESENRALRERLRQAAERVQGLLARLQFLEEER